jgi:hypothetical protein
VSGTVKGQPCPALLPVNDHIHVGHHHPRRIFFKSEISSLKLFWWGASFSRWRGNSSPA